MPLFLGGNSQLLTLQQQHIYTHFLRMFNTKKKIINYLYVLSHIIEDETLIFSRFFVIKDNVVARHHLV